MAHKYDTMRRDLQRFAKENPKKDNERVITEWLNNNSDNSVYLMPEISTLRRWLNGRK